MSTKEEIKKKETEIINLAKDICVNLINKEYAELSEKLIKKLGRKKDVPFVRGKNEIWATAVVHAIGSINFLSDKSFLPYCSLDKLCKHYNTNKSTVGNKAGEIRKLLKLNPFDEDFSTKHMKENNPWDNLGITQEGFIAPVNDQPGLFDRFEEDELEEEFFEDEFFEEDISELEDYLFSKIAIFVRLKTPFFEWINKYEPEGDDMLKPGDYMDGFTYLVNDYYLLDPTINKETILNENYMRILHDLLLTSGLDPDLLPKNFSFKLFKSWCDCFISITILDLDAEN